MADEILTEEPVNEKSDEELIYEQTDCTQSVLHEEGGFGNVICTVVTSATLGKKVVSVPQYIEEIENNQVVGRRVVSYEKISLAITEPVSVNTLAVIAQEPAERGI